MRQRQHTHADVDWKGKRLLIRDLEPSDLEALVRYWSDADPDFLCRLGVDRIRLGDAQAIHRRFAAALPSGDLEQASLGFAIQCDDNLIGYTLINCYSAGSAISHWHLIDPDVRGLGISSALYPWRLHTYFTCTAIEKLTHQTRVSNVQMNAVLDKFVAVAETRFLDRPDGVALPGNFNIRYVTRSEANEILCLAQAGAASGTNKAR